MTSSHIRACVRRYRSLNTFTDRKVPRFSFGRRRLRPARAGAQVGSPEVGQWSASNALVQAGLDAAVAICATGLSSRFLAQKRQQLPSEGLTLLAAVLRFPH